MTSHFTYTVHGSGHGSGPGLLLAHGAGGGAEANFGPVLPELAAGHTVVAPDYPGAGETPRNTGPLDLDMLADGLVASALHAGVERFGIVGYSLGTAVAVRAATRHPDRVTGLVLTAGLAAPDNRLGLAAQVWRQLLLDGDRDLLSRFLMFAGTGPGQLNQQSPTELDKSLDLLSDFIRDGSLEQIELVGRIDTRSDLSVIAVPSLVIATTADVLVGPELSGELAAGIRGAELVEIDAGHGVITEETAEWLAAVLPFLSGLA
jgi:pimeloyl-ACP methyl ester carboxylesterase